MVSFLHLFRLSFFPVKFSSFCLSSKWGLDFFSQIDTIFFFTKMYFELCFRFSFLGNETKTSSLVRTFYVFWMWQYNQGFHLHHPCFSIDPWSLNVYQVALISTFFNNFWDNPNRINRLLLHLIAYWSVKYGFAFFQRNRSVPRPSHKIRISYFRGWNQTHHQKLQCHLHNRLIFFVSYELWFVILFTRFGYEK